jgi:CheY-like chemotaxis protein
VKSRRLTGLRLLLVEDNLINQQVAAETLILEGASVALAASGQQAIDLITGEAPFDAVLMDIQMPGMDGYEATRHIRDILDLKELPIIAMTANVLPADREHCLATGMNDHIGKPIDVDKMVEALRRNCGMTEEPAMETQKTTTTDQSINRPGFDCDSALKRLGSNRSLYSRMMRSFENDQGVVMERVRRQLKLGDSEGAARELHTIKGVAATLGATALSSAAGVGESELKSSNYLDKKKELLQEVEHLFCEACRVFKDVVQALEPLPGEGETVLEMSRESAIAGLLELEALLTAGNMRAMQHFQDIRHGLGSAVGAKHFLPLLDEAIQRLDFAAAGELSRNIREERT